jgi:hypothetical protein
VWHPEGLFKSIVLMFTILPMTPVSDDSSNDGANSKTPISSPGSKASASLLYSVAVVTLRLTKRNTCGTVYLGLMLWATDKDVLIKCVCGVFHAHMLTSAEHRGSGGSAAIILANSLSHSTSLLHRSCCDDANEHAIFNDWQSPGDYQFLDKSSIMSLLAVMDHYLFIFLRLQKEVECIIILFIYVERLIKMTNGRLSHRPKNWRSVLFSFMVLALKVWDDLSMWNYDFLKIGPSGMTFTLSRTNELEIKLLQTLRYRVKVEASGYAACSAGVVLGTTT